MNWLRKHWLPCISACLIGLPVGCGDDDSDTSSDAGPAEGGAGGRAGSSAGAGGRGGSGGRAGAGGRTSAGTGSVSEGGRNAAAGSGGAGGGEDDAGVDGTTYAPITRVGDRAFSQLNDLRGLKFGANGKIWASGHSDADASNRQLVLARFNQDGSLDTSFDSDGWVSYDAVPGADNDEQSLDLIELGNGDVIVLANISDQKGGAALTDMAGGADGKRSNGTDVVLIRFDSSGAPVTSWGTNGRALVKFGWDASADANWPAPLYTSSNMENQRYYRPGTGSDPMSNPPLAHSGYPSDSGWAIELDAREGIERLVVFGFGPAAVGGGTQRYDNDRYIARILAETGAPDPAFNGAAAYTFNSLTDAMAFPDGGRRGIVEENGSIVASGYTNYGSSLGNHVLLLRLKADGTPDEEFGFGFDPSRPGALRVNPFVTDMGVTECYQVGRQSNGRYVTTGYGRATGMDVTSSTLGFQVSDGVDLVSVGIQADGSGIDTKYGKNGMIAIQSEMLGLAGTEDRGRDLVVLPDDRVVHAGRFGAGPAIFVTTPNGALDESVGDDESGRFAYEASAMTAGSHFFAIALSPDKKFVAASTSAAADGARLAVLQVGASD